MAVWANDRGDPAPYTASVFMPVFLLVSVLFVSTVGVVHLRVACAPLVVRMLLAIARHGQDNTCMGAHK